MTPRPKPDLVGPPDRSGRRRRVTPATATMPRRSETTPPSDRRPAASSAVQMVPQPARHSTTLSSRMQNDPVRMRPGSFVP